MFLVQTKTQKQWDAASKIIEKNAENDMVLAGDPFMFIENLDELSKVISGDLGSNGTLVLKNNLHIWNSYTVESLLAFGLSEFSFIASYELTEHELKDLYVSLPESVTMFLPIYGRVPLMYTKNCVKKTEGLCNNTSEFVGLKDRKNAYFPVYSDCEKCRNIIYNSVPLSLHNHMTGKRGLSHVFKDFYIEFTDEPTTTVESILNYYLGKLPLFPLTNYTTGHFKKPVL